MKSRQSSAQKRIITANSAQSKLSARLPMSLASPQQINNQSYGPLLKSPGKANEGQVLSRSANRSPSAGLRSEVTKKSAASKRKD